MESRRSKSMGSICIPFYSITPIVGSPIPILLSPDTEIPFQTLPISKIFATLFVHEDMVRSGHKSSVEQRSVSSTTYKNFSPIVPLLPGTVGAPTCRLSGKRDSTAIPRTVRIREGISALQVYRIHQ